MPITKTPLPTWNKKVKKALIDRNMTVKELAEQIGYTAIYTRNIVNAQLSGKESKVIIKPLSFKLNDWFFKIPLETIV